MRKLEVKTLSLTEDPLWGRQRSNHLGICATLPAGVNLVAKKHAEPITIYENAPAKKLVFFLILTIYCHRKAAPALFFEKETRGLRKRFASFRSEAKNPVCLCGLSHPLRERGAKLRRNRSRESRLSLASAIRPGTIDIDIIRESEGLYEW